MNNISVSDIVKINNPLMKTVYVEVMEISRVLDSFNQNSKNLIRYKGEVLNGEHLACVDFIEEDIIEIYNKENKNAK